MYVKMIKSRKLMEELEKYTVRYYTSFMTTAEE